MENSPMCEEKEESSQGSYHRMCRCGDRAPIWNAWTDDNSSRRFMGCPNYKDSRKNCHYFAWIDPELPEASKRIVLAKYLRSKIEVLDSQIKTLVTEMEQEKREGELVKEKAYKLKMRCAKLKDLNDCMKVEITKRKEREKWYIVMICIFSLFFAMMVGFNNRFRNNGSIRF